MRPVICITGNLVNQVNRVNTYYKDYRYEQKGF